MGVEVGERFFVERSVFLSEPGEIDRPLSARALVDVLAVEVGAEHVVVRASVGVLGSASQSLTWSNGRPNGPAGVIPMKLIPRLGVNGAASRASDPAVREGEIFATGLPSRIGRAASPRRPTSFDGRRPSIPVKPTIEMWTLAPSRIQSRSLTAKKISPDSLMRLGTSRFAPPRMPCVASSPARRIFPASMRAQAFSNQ